MTRAGKRQWLIGAFAAAALFAPRSADAVYLDKGETMKFGMRSYANARVGTEQTDKYVEIKDFNGEPTFAMISQTFPESAAGHLRQNRFFVEADFDHDLHDLLQQGFGPLALLKQLPFTFKSLSYHLTYRGEGDGIYDWGPREYSSADSFQPLLGDASGDINPPTTCQLGICPNIPAARSELHRHASNRNRLFQAYGEFEIGNLFVRAGRQILVWGETDNFRLMDNINPIDNSFGGFLIDLDERRVPLDMLRMNYFIGEVGEEISEAYVEGYAAIDNHVGYYPEIPSGSPWTLPNLGTPNGIPPGQTQSFLLRPGRTIGNTRGGARLVFNAYDVTFSVAHYYTYADNPLAQTCVAPAFPVQKISTQGGVSSIPGCPIPPSNMPIAQPPVCTTPGGDGVFGTSDDRPPGCRPPGTFSYLAPTAYAVALPARMQVSGLSATFAVPASVARLVALSGEPIVRTELAYFKDEPSYSQQQLDPFIYHFQGARPGTGGTLQRDSINFVLAMDLNQFIRPLNPGNSFFFSTQFFYKHIKNAPDDLVLPVPAKYVATTQQPSLGAIEPIFVHSSPDQILQTLFISTSYLGGQVEPNLTIFYDWSGALTYIPSVTFLHDPFRLTISMDILDSGTLKGNSGVSLLRDRDNVLFQLEYVI